MNPTIAEKRTGYFHADPWYGLNDWEPVISFIRSLMEDSDVPWCFDYARKLVLGRTTPMSQSLAQFLGEMRDEDAGGRTTLRRIRPRRPGADRQGQYQGFCN